jgi:hypothetical protein
MVRSSLQLVALLVPVALAVACSSSKSTGGAGGSSSSSTSTSSTSTSTSSTSTSTSTSSGTGGASAGTGGASAGTGGASAGTGGASGAGGAAACQQACETNNAAAYKVFEGYEIASCGCAAAGPCKSDCTAACSGTTPNGMTPSVACDTCLQMQGSMGASSACTLSAAETCIGDTTCAAFAECGLACP